MSSSQFWDVLARHHARLENNYFDLATIRGLADSIREPVLVVGAGQGLLVAELRKKGLQCDGIDFSSAMIQQAKSRRKLDLIHADARAMPLSDGTCATIIFATGVIDFTSDEADIQKMLNEGRRVLQPAGRILVGFYRLSPVLEEFVKRVGLLRDHVLSQRECLEMYLLSSAQMVKWIAKRARTGYLLAGALLFQLAVQGTMREKMLTFRMQKIFRDAGDANALLRSAPQKQPYRDESEVRSLFERLAIPLKEIRPFPACWIAEIAEERRSAMPNR